MRLVNGAPKKHAQWIVIYLTFFLLLSIPIILFGLAQDDFDTRREAFEDLELSEENPCLISLPNVNPYSLEMGTTVTVQVDAQLKDQGIEKLQIFNSVGEEIYLEEFEGSPIEIATTFPFTPEVSGRATLSGVLTKVAGGSVACQITSPYGIRGLQVIPNNSAPEFTSSPSESIPSQNIETGDMYEYTLTATDIDGDRINYVYSFTPRADWLKPTVIEDGSGGNLTIKFSGKTDEPASYLANVFIHDGYSQNLRSQSWVINVSPSENDIPVVTIIDPVSSLRIDRGTSFRTRWEATDLNHIVGYELFITNNPTNEDTWIAIDEDIPYDTNSYTVDTSTLDSGTYKVIVQATDNQDPPATGKGISPEIVVSAITDDEPDTDDRVIITQPQVTNMSPTETEDITNRRVSVRATIVASTEAQIDEDSITFTLNNRDISDEIRINRISQQEYNLIYQPERDLETGLHKAEIVFSDTEGLEAEKSWNFTILEEERDEDVYVVFGYEIAKNIVHIVGIGVLTIILALVTPFIIFSIWKDDKDSNEKNQNTKLPPSTPTDNTEYYVEDDLNQIEEKIQTPSQETQEEIKVEDAWNKYSAAEPVEQEERDSLKGSRKEDMEQEKKSQPPVQTPPQTPTETTTQQEINTPTEKKQEETKETIEQPSPPKETKSTEPEQPKAEKQVTPPPPQQPQEVPQEEQIPEPEIPEISDLENLSKQLKEIREGENKEAQSSENTQ